jgi:hypothetical protein
MGGAGKSSKDDVLMPASLVTQGRVCLLNLSRIPLSLWYLACLLAGSMMVILQNGFCFKLVLGILAD